jgi:hypothetical protein
MKYQKRNPIYDKRRELEKQGQLNEAFLYAANHQKERESYEENRKHYSTFGFSPSHFQPESEEAMLFLNEFYYSIANSPTHSITPIQLQKRFDY